ncbi:accessory gene regulator ArgB-like protein [Planococcus maitriensis]|uniref:Accessory regulator AgrB n=1 Tax=Planococcus maitriensis TaxID=221799 RepID=A0A365K547_9BACL|nr:accessory gene regulator B family protein [Planococcus maitriensis]RAZ67292.1 hypothetical protein DP119_11035 [Planococcus maitriensis]
MHLIESVLIKSLVRPDHSEVDKIKIRFGVQTILSNGMKLLMVYATAILLGCLIPTLITHAGFFILRQVSLGYHFKTEWSCILWSIFAFPVLALVLERISLPSESIWAAAFAALLFIALAGPAGTKKNPIQNKYHYQYLQKKLLIRLLIVVGALVLSSNDIRQFLVLGIVVQGVALGIQLLKREEGFR